MLFVEDGYPIIFVQKRMGKNKKIFPLYKFRTMHHNAEKMRSHYLHLNMADGPVFKIRQDPRYTRLGKWLSWSGLDELPQLWNIVTGTMLFVGPRPLPVAEAQLIPLCYSERFSVYPGITSPWVVNGMHRNSFAQWMEMDLQYVSSHTVLGDISILAATFVAVTVLCYRLLLHKGD
jgi:lipopolysaccharide/colanic/teichoic acid biosynthesis glycosyltransferase